jgi:hypothetical protein
MPSFFETIKPLQDMINKNAQFSWGSKENKSFNKKKQILIKHQHCWVHILIDISSSTHFPPIILLLWS